MSTLELPSLGNKRARSEFIVLICEVTGASPYCMLRAVKEWSNEGIIPYLPVSFSGKTNHYKKTKKRMLEE